MSERRWRFLSFHLVAAGLAWGAPAAAQEAVAPAASGTNPPRPPDGHVAASEGAVGVSLVGTTPAPTVLAPVTRLEPSEPLWIPASSGTSFRADFKLPFAVATFVGGNAAAPAPFAPVPQLVLGFQTGRFGLGAGIGFTRFGVSGGGGFSFGSQSLTELLFSPTVTVDAFQSRDRKVAFYLLGAPVFGVIVSQTFSKGNVDSDLGFQFALGASYALHENFRLGMEVGPVGHFYNTQNTTYTTMSLYTALVATFVYPK